jgi:putative transposase
VIKTPRSEVGDHLLILNEAHARRVRAEYQRHYNAHRPHQAPDSSATTRHTAATNRTRGASTGKLLRTHVLRGVINEYRYAA